MKRLNWLTIWSSHLLAGIAIAFGVSTAITAVFLSNSVIDTSTDNLVKRSAEIRKSLIENFLDSQSFIKNNIRKLDRDGFLGLLEVENPEALWNKKSSDTVSYSFPEGCLLRFLPSKKAIPRSNHYSLEACMSLSTDRKWLYTAIDYCAKSLRDSKPGDIESHTVIIRARDDGAATNRDTPKLNFKVKDNKLVPEGNIGWYETAVWDPVESSSRCLVEPGTSFAKQRIRFKADVREMALDLEGLEAAIFDIDVLENGITIGSTLNDNGKPRQGRLWNDPWVYFDSLVGPGETIALLLEDTQDCKNETIPSAYRHSVAISGPEKIENSILRLFVNSFVDTTDDCLPVNNVENMTFYYNAHRNSLRREINNLMMKLAFPVSLFLIIGIGGSVFMILWIWIPLIRFSGKIGSIDVNSNLKNISLPYEEKSHEFGRLSLAFKELLGRLASQQRQVKEAASEQRRLAFELQEAAVKEREIATREKLIAENLRETVAKEKEISMREKTAAEEQRRLAFELREAAVKEREIATREKLIAENLRETVAKEKEISIREKSAAEISDQQNYMLAHEVKSPTHVLKERYKEDTEVRRIISAIAVIDQINGAITSEDDETYQTLKINNFVRKYVEQRVDRAEFSPIKSVEYFEEQEITLHYHYIELALDNICRNAARFRDPKDSDIVVSASKIEGRPAILVSNTGPIIPREKRESIFKYGYSEEYANMASRVKSTSHQGFGLFVSMRYMAIIKGDLRVEDSDVGAVFSLILPE